MYRFIVRERCKVNLQRTLPRITRKYSIKLPTRGREAALVKLVMILSPLVVVGGTVTYAKYDPGFRHALEKNIPGVESFIKIVLREEKLFPGIGKQFDEISKSLDGVKSKVSGIFGVGKLKKLPIKLNEMGDEVADLSNAVVKPKAELAKSTSKVVIKSSLKPKTTESLPNSILELEKAVKVATSTAVKEYNKAIGILKSFNADVLKVVDHSVEGVDPSHWASLKNKTIARDFSVEAAEMAAKNAMAVVVECEIALTKITTAENHNQVIAIRHKIKQLVDQINNARKELENCKDLASTSEKYWRSVKKARNYFIEEIESIFPGLNLAEKQLHLSKADLDLFITHAYSHVLAYQKELLRLQTDGERRLQLAIEALRENSEPEVLKTQVEYLLETEKRKIAIENQKKIVQVRAESERILREQLKKQAIAHIEYITEAIAFKESELKRDFNRQLEERLQQEKKNFELELAALIGKMRGMNAALQTRAETERIARRSQKLWAACQALWATVKTNEHGPVNWQQELRPLKSELEAIAKIAADDELVTQIIQSLPREVEERGVFPEDALRQRFENVERVARKVAFVPEDGGTLPAYFFSYLQSIFVVRPSEVVSQDELDDAKFDFSKLDTYDILNRAKYFVERGDLLSALRYMNLLKGAPRTVARDWLKEARVLLETQQAANTLMAHAAASSILYL